MDIELRVTNRLLVREDLEHIPSGGINDVRCRITFDEGYGWESIPNITAIFSRETKWAFQINIQPDEYFYVPASILARQGSVFVGLIGSTSDGQKVVQTTTCPLTVEPNNLNRNTQVIYPLNQHNEYDTDAYAQYVAAVNTLATRAEKAAEALEDVAYTQCYTKTESDAKYIAKKYFNKEAMGVSVDISLAEIGSTPAVKVLGEYPKTTNSDNLENPSTFYGVTDITVTYSKEDGTVLASQTFSGLGNIYKLSTTTADYVLLLPSGQKIHKETQLLDISTSSHTWISENVLRISLTNENPISELDKTVLTNIGSIVLDVGTDYIDLNVPYGTDLTDYKLIYALKTSYDTIGGLTPLPVIPEGTKYLTVFVKLGSGDPQKSSYALVNYEVNLEQQIKNMGSVLSSLLTRVQTLEAKVVNLDERVTALEEEDEEED